MYERSTRGFASDNHAGIHPEALAAIAEANEGHAVAYGDDPWTARAEEALRAQLGERARPFIVFNGTGANVSGLEAVLRPYEAVICAESAHIATDECGAPERYTGSKLLTVATPDGRLTPALVDTRLGVSGEHHARPRVVSISNATELGTVYAPDRLRELADHAHARGLLLHVDGARICNAAAHLDVPLRALAQDAGVDVLSFGGTKNGLLAAEAVVFFDDAPAADFRFVRKQAMQLASKMRFPAAQLSAMLEGDLWLRCASHANAMARRLAEAAAAVPGVEVLQPVEANEVFARVPAAHVPALQAAYPFYVWDAAESVVRWVCSWDTTEGDVDGFATLLRETSV